jgi:hypothetical protein
MMLLQDHQPECGLELLWLVGHRDTPCTFQRNIGHRLCVRAPLRPHCTCLLLSHSDLWVVNAACNSGCQDIPVFDPTASSSFTQLSRSFSITYGSGNAAGKLGQDGVEMAGFTIPNQIFGKWRFVSHRFQGYLPGVMQVFAIRFLQGCWKAPCLASWGWRFLLLPSLGVRPLCRRSRFQERGRTR